MDRLGRKSGSRSQEARGAALKLTAIILTFNSADSIAEVVRAAQSVAERLLVVDSHSTDETVAIAQSLGCEVVSHPFENYSAQREWAQAYADLDPQAWVLHLDSDEVLSPELAASIKSALQNPEPGVEGYLMRRLTHFWGKPIRYGHMNPSWHLRLYRASSGRCERRLYDQHFVCSGPTRRLPGILLDLQKISLDRWTATHNRWSTLEAREVVAERRPDPQDVLAESLFGDRRERKRWLKNRLWYRIPLYLRAYLFFFYSYVLKLGFLDGRVGLVYHTLQAFWFRFLVDAKIDEALRQGRPESAGRPAPEISTQVGTDT